MKRKRKHWPKKKHVPTVPNEGLPWMGLVTYGYNSPADLPDWVRSHRRSQLEPEQRLMLQLLEDAIETATWKGRAVYKHTTHNSSKARNERERDEARRWIERRDSEFSAYVFSFDSVCAHLGADPSAARKALVARWRKAA